jgi:hypothetical protein
MLLIWHLNRFMQYIAEWLDRIRQTKIKFVLFVGSSYDFIAFFYEVIICWKLKYYVSVMVYERFSYFIVAKYHVMGFGPFITFVQSKQTFCSDDRNSCWINVI